MRKNQATEIGHNALLAETTLIGNILSNKDIRIDGRIEGDITCQGKVVIGESGSVKGSIQAASAEIAGRVQGNIVVAEMLLLKATAELTGEIKTARITIEPNAILNGSCSMQQKASK